MFSGAPARHVQAGLSLFRRWGQPGQQQGRRFPSLSSLQTLSIRLNRVFGLFASSTQQIHSFRARGVIPSHRCSAIWSAARLFLKSSGTLCNTPVAISFGYIITVWSVLLLESNVPAVHSRVGRGPTGSAGRLRCGTRWMSVTDINPHGHSGKIAARVCSAASVSKAA